MNDSLKIVLELANTTQNASTQDVPNSLDWTTIILSLISFLGVVIGTYKYLEAERLKRDKHTGDNIFNYSSKTLEKEAEENRSFQQSMVNSTQKSYIDLVNRLMGLTEDNIQDVSSLLTSFSSSLERQTALIEMVNKRLNTHERRNREMLYEFLIEINSFLKNAVESIHLDEETNQLIFDLEKLKKDYSNDLDFNNKLNINAKSASTSSRKKN